jgi:hypothetical protein
MPPLHRYAPIQSLEAQLCSEPTGLPFGDSPQGGNDAKPLRERSLSGHSIDAERPTGET